MGFFSEVRRRLFENQDFNEFSLVDSTHSTWHDLLFNEKNSYIRSMLYNMRNYNSNSNRQFFECEEKIACQSVMLNAERL